MIKSVQSLLISVILLQDNFPIAEGDPVLLENLSKFSDNIHVNPVTY